MTDAQDNPPNSCSVTYESDCNSGCIVSAIKNMVRSGLTTTNLRSFAQP